MTTTTLDQHSHAGADGERLCYACPRCGVTYDAPPGAPAPECDCDEADALADDQREHCGTSGEGADSDDEDRF